MSNGTKAVAIAVGAVLLGLGSLVLMLRLSQTGDAEITGTLGRAEFDAGFTEVLADGINDGGDQPLIFNDLAGGDRDIYIQHLGDVQNEGWFAFENRVPGEADDCFAQWDPDEGEFFSTCDDAVTFPADGEGLTTYPTRVSADEHLIIDLRQ